MDSLHFTILPSHTSERAEQLLTALRDAVSTVKVTLSLSLSLSFNFEPSSRQTPPSLAPGQLASMAWLLGYPTKLSSTTSSWNSLTNFIPSSSSSCVGIETAIVLPVCS